MSMLKLHHHQHLWPSMLKRLGVTWVVLLDQLTLKLSIIITGTCGQTNLAGFRRLRREQLGRRPGQRGHRPPRHPRRRLLRSLVPGPTFRTIRVGENFRRKTLENWKKWHKTLFMLSLIYDNNFSVEQFCLTG